MVTDGKETCAGAHLAVYTNIKSLLCTPEANVLYVNYTSVGKKKKDPHMAEEPRMRPGAASHLPWRDNLPVPSLRKEGARSHQSCGKQAIPQKHPRAHQKSKNRITGASFRQALLAQTAETATSCLANTTPQGCSERWEIQGKHQSFVLFCFLKGDEGRAWF